MATNANLTFVPSTVAGWFVRSDADGNPFGIHLGDGRTCSFNGSADSPTYWVRTTTVQEGSSTNWDGPWAPGGIIGTAWPTSGPPDIATAPVLSAHFTRFSILGDDTTHFRDYYGMLVCHIRDSEFWGGSLGSYASQLWFTNCLFDGVALWSAWDGVPPTDCGLILRNCLFHGGSFAPTRSAPGGSPPYYPLWSARDTVFDGTTFGFNDATNAASTVTDFDYNAYVLGQGPTNYQGAHDLAVTNFVWLAGPGGNFYQQSNSALIDSGDVTAGTVGLWHFCTQTNETKEGGSIVDRSYHYIALDTNGVPVDTDGGGTPDYIENPSGDGATNNVGESNWMDASDDNKWLVQPEYLRCEYRVDPWGVDARDPITGAERPRLFWIVTSSQRAAKQLAYQVWVATDTNKLDHNQPDMWDSGQVLSDETIHIEYNGQPLQSGQRLWWKARSWNLRTGVRRWSTNAFFQMGLLNAGDWTAKWLTTSSDPGSSVSPIYRKAFAQPTNEIKRATVYVSAKGVYELWLDGQRIGTHVLAPQWTDYRRRIQYQTFDVTTSLSTTNTDGTNHVVGAIVGEGWYSGSIAQSTYTTGHDKQLLVQLVVERNDGTTNTVVTDTSWKWSSSGPIRGTSIYDGETYDSRNEANVANWSTYAYTGEATYFSTTVAATNAIPSQLVPQPDDPLEIIQYVSPVGMWTNSDGAQTVRTYDLGQNMAGWCILFATNLTGVSNSTVSLVHAEVLDLNANNFPIPNGSINVNSLRSVGTPAAQTETNYLNGSTTGVFQPHFTYHGFHAGARPSGQFTCSNTNVNRLTTNILWTQKSNLSGVPTDCPQRAERYGYLGDAQIFSQTACFNFDMAAYYTKFVRDIRDEQGTGSPYPFGMYPYYAPYNGRFDWRDIGWQIAGVILPWRLYENYADTRILSEHFLSASNYMGYLASTFPNYIDPNGPAGTSLLVKAGDWVNMGAFNYVPSGWPSGYAGVNPFVFEACLYAHAADLMAGMSQAIQQGALLRGDGSQAATFGSNYLYYTNLAFVIRTNFFFQQDKLDIQTNANGAISWIGDGNQGDFAFPLYVDMVPQTQRVYCVQLLLTNTHVGFSNYCDLFGSPPQYTNLVSGGIQSAGREMLELSRDGYTQVAYQALTNPHLQQWLYSVTNGTPGVFQETTISEHGNSYISGPGGGYLSGDNSFNHCALGSVGEWIYKTVGGVSADELDTGYRNALVRPQAGGGVTNSATSLSQIRGPITVAWTNDVNARILRLGLTNPANTTASLYFPTTNLTSILEGSAPATNSTGVLFYQLTNGWALFKVGAGGYSFTVTNIVLGP